MKPDLTALVLDPIPQVSWYAVVAILLQMLVIQGTRKHSKLALLWQKVPDGFRFVPGAVMSFAGGFVAAFSQGAPFGWALAVGGGAIVGIALPASGLAAWLKESHLPWDGGPGGARALKRSTILPTLTFWMTVVMGAALVSCTSIPGVADPTSLSAKSRDRYERLTYNLAVGVLDSLDSLESDRMKALRTRAEPPTPDEIAAEESYTKKLRAVKDALGVVHDILEGKRGEALVPALLAALDSLLGVLDEGALRGMPVNDALRGAVQSARAMLTEVPHG